MDVFNLYAKLSLNTSEYEKGVEKAKGGASSLMDVFSGTVLGNVVTDGLRNIANGFVSIGKMATGAAISIGKASLDSYGEYEQLVGGVETLYKDSAKTVEQYAKRAFANVGMSANDYMETSTSFAASLVSSLAGDTDAAAEMSNMAISDMADNWNKMGSSVQSVQDAYRGFSKQNYTMLDNLKIGYGGTKTEMQRLLADADALNAKQGVYTKYSIDSFSDIVQAIHVVQTEMGITGTTAREASSTIQGSTSAAKAAWSNLVTGVADDNADFILLVNDFVDSVGTAARNILPRIEIALDGAAKLIEHLVPPIMAKLPALIETVLPKLARSAVNIVQKLVSEISANAGKLIDSAVQLITVLGNGIYQMLPTVAQSALQIILTMVSKLNENLPQMLDTAGQMLIAFVQGISNHLPDIVKAAGSIIGTLLTYFVNHLPEIVNGALKMGGAIVDGIMQGISAAWGGLTSFVQGLWNGIKGIFTINASDVKNNTGSGSSSRRHAGGLDYVPYNDYVANLHRGEMVLTAREADEYRKNGVQSGTGFVVNQTIYAAKQTPVELAAATRAAFQRARWATV